MDAKISTRSDAPYTQGFILIAVLWVTALLSLFALYYSSSARVQGMQALNTEKWLMHFSLLQSGMDWGYHEYRKFKANESLLSSKEQLEEQADQTLDLKNPRYEPYTMTAGNQTVEVSIVDLSGKVSINEVDEPLLRDILSACGVQMGVGQTTVINSILDWMDQDDQHRQEGAEKDYYMGLEPPYRPKNGPLESIEELLLIKGIDRDLFHGNEEVPGLKDFLTVYGEQTTMDINNASPQAFLIIEEMPLDVVQDIVAYRKENRIDELTDLLDIVPQKHFGELEQYFSVTSSPYIEIVARMVTETGSSGQSMQKLYHINGS
ncbi:MAG: type II secretion system protein GspK [Desulfovermiculus sp.]